MNFVLPKKRKKSPMGLKQPEVLRVPQFLRFVRQHECSANSGPNMYTNRMACGGAIEAAHIRSGTDGGTGMKPSDCYALPLCSEHHRRQHQIGEGPFEKEIKITMRATADWLWSTWLKTDTGRRWALKTGDVAAGDRNDGSKAPPQTRSDER